MRADKKSHLKPDKKTAPRSPKRVHMGYTKKTALLEEAISQMNAGKYGRSSAALKELLNLDPQNMEARRLFATLHLRLGSLIPARQAFDSLINEAVERQDYWLAESLLREYLAAGPRCVPFLEKLGRIFEEKGDALEAVTEYGKAIDILLEDPDPENAQRPAELYAKIRELAPASPAGFRLASLFNAQTGELIRSPLPTPVEVPVSDGVDLISADLVTITDEAMPWNGGEDLQEPAPTSCTASWPGAGSPPSDQSLAQGPEVLGAGSDRAGEELHGPGESCLLEPHKNDHATVGEVGSISSNVPVSVCLQSPDPDVVASDTGCSIVEAVPTDVPISPAAMVGDGSVSEPLAITPEHVAWQPAPCQEQISQIASMSVLMPLARLDTIKIPTVDEVPIRDNRPALSIAESSPSRLPSELLGSVPLESAPAPMPWDQVEDATIHIVDAVPDRNDEAVAASAPASIPWDQVQDTSIHFANRGPDPDMPPAESVPRSESMVTDVQPTAESPAEPLPIGLDRMQDTSIPISGATPESDMLPAESIRQSESMMSEVQAPAGLGSAPAPMPWDQVEDATIYIADAVPEPDMPPAEPVPRSQSMVVDIPSSAESPSEPLPIPDRMQDTTIHIAGAAPESDMLPALSVRQSGSIMSPAGLGSAPVSMPWDQVQDTTIHIVDAAAEPAVLRAQSVTQAESMMAEDQAAVETKPVAFSQPEERAQEEPLHLVSVESERQPPITSNNLVLDTAPPADCSLSEPHPPVATDSVPAPLPWDQAQDTTIRIADVASERDMVSQASAEPESPLFVVRQPTTIGPECLQEEQTQEAIRRLASTTSDVASQVLATEEPLVASSDSRAIPKGEKSSRIAESESARDARREPPKRGGFSWQSISRAWKFGKHAPAEEPKLDLMRPQSPGSREESSTPAESGWQPAEATVQSNRGQTDPSAEAIDDIPDDIRQAGGAPGVPVGEDPALSSSEHVPGNGKRETVSTLCAAAGPVPPTERECRLERIGEGSCLPTDSSAGAEGLEALDRSAAEVFREADATFYDASRPGDIAPSSPFLRDASDLQQDAVSGVPSAGASEDEVALPPLSVWSEPNLPAEGHAEGQAIEPVREESSDRAGAAAEVAAPVTGHQSSLALQEEGTDSALKAPRTDRETRADDRGPTASSLRHLIESPQVPVSSDGDRAHWKTGEVAVQVHRPAPNTRQNASSPTAHRVISPHVTPQDQPLLAPSAAEPLEDQDEWIRTGAAIRFTEPFAHVLPPATPAVLPEAAPHEALVSSAASAIECLFASTETRSSTASVEHTAYPKPGRRRLRAKLARVRIGVSILIRSGFSTTRAMVLSTLALVCVLGTLTAIGLGAVALTWVVMEESPSSAFRRYTTTPVKSMLDSKQNGYVLLLGFDVPVGQVGPGHQGQGQAAGIVAGCISQDSNGSGGQTEGSASVANRLFRARDPVSAIQSRRDTIKGWVGKSERALARYTQWLTLPFEDWGYGQSVTLPCRSIIFAHRVYVAEGMLLGTEAGMARLEADMEAWRTALAQARTLPLKAMALQAVQDDAAVASGFLMDPGFDVKMLGRVTHMVRPLGPDEWSLRWPMQSELVWASQHAEAQIKAERAEDLPLYAATAAMLPLPTQRRLNHYAEYFEIASQMAAGHPYEAVPKRNQYIHAPPANAIDYFRDPIENLLDLEPLPEWSRYFSRLGDLDARLRLVRLQAWLRRGPQDANLAGRIAKAGQDFYDPYTGFPMLVNRKKSALYSVGHDGRDQDADPDSDIVVGIPISPATPLSGEDSGLAMSP